MDFIDVNIFLQPSVGVINEYKRVEEEIKEQLPEEIKFEQCPNIPHLSLYQFSIAAESVDILKTELNSIVISLPSFKMNKNLNIKGQNIFWSSDDASSLEPLVKFHTSIVEHFKSFKAQEPLMQIQAAWNTLPEEKKHLVEKYGVCWGIPGFFDPHLTVVYNFSDPSNTLAPIVSGIKTLNVDFCASAIGVARIGFHGNIEEVLFLKPLP